MPTLLELSGASPSTESPLDGLSLVTVLLEQRRLDEPRRLFWESGKAACMRDGDWKLILNGGKSKRPSPSRPYLNWDRPDDGRDTAALFHLAEDPGEHVNLLEDHADRVKRMRNAISRWRVDVST